MPQVRRLEAEAADSVWASRLFLAGESEGAMVASRMYDGALHERLWAVARGSQQEHGASIEAHAPRK